MEDGQQPVNQAVPAPVATPPVSTMPSPVPKQPKKRGSALAWILVVLLLISTIAGFALYMMQKKETDDANKKAATATTATAAAVKESNDSKAKLSAAETTLKAAYLLPDKSTMSPQCSGGNNSQTYIAPINQEAIEGYKVYVSNCLGDLIAGKTTTGKVIAFKVDADGKQTFAFGAGSGEPYCISGKITTAAAAAAISKATTIPVCKTF